MPWKPLNNDQSSWYFEISLNGTTPSVEIPTDQNIIPTSIEMPDTWDTANINYEVRTINGGFQDYYGADGALFASTVAQGNTYKLGAFEDMAALAAHRVIKLKSSASQGSARTCYVIGTRLYR